MFSKLREDILARRAAAGVACAVIGVWFLRNLRRQARMPPKGPGIVEALQTLVSTYHKQRDWAKKYGGIFRSWDPLIGTKIYIADPAIMYDVTVKAGNLYREPCAYGRSPDFAAYVRDIMGPSVTGFIGEEWRWRKDSLLREFSNARLLQSDSGLLEAIMYEGNLLCDNLGRAADKGEVVRVDELTTRAATGAVLYFMFGRHVEFDENKFRKSSKDLMTVLRGVLTPTTTKAQLKHLREVQSEASEVFNAVGRSEINAIMEEIETGRRTPGRMVGMMETLCKGEKRYLKNGLDGLLADIRVFINAGYETTAHSLAFAFGLLAEPQNSHVAQKARRQAKEAMSQGLERKTLMEQTSYLDKVFQEALRLFPLAPALLGKCYKDFDLKVGERSYLIPRGATFVFLNDVGQRCSRLWPDPDRCNPEHWEGGPGEKRLMTFNLGAHACPGRNLSLLEARVFLAMVLSKFRFELPPGVDCTRGEEELLLRPKDRMPLRVFRL